jgi:hypothetical protein
LRLYDGVCEFEGLAVGREMILVRGELGGLAPEILHPDSLLERAVCLTERRHQTRRLGPADRRKRRNGDRRGATSAWIPAKGRRRGDVIAWDDDLETVRALVRMAQRISGPTGRVG